MLCILLPQTLRQREGLLHKLVDAHKRQVPTRISHVPCLDRGVDFWAHANEMMPASSAALPVTIAATTTSTSESMDENSKPGVTQ